MKRPSIRWTLSGVAILIGVAVYGIMSATGFYSKPWQELLLNLSFVLAAGWSAWRASRLWRRFVPTDSPRRIWRLFAWGLWCWAVAELLWALLARIYGEAMPVVTIADLSWVVGCLILLIALALQFRVLHRLAAGQFWGLLAVALGVLLLLSGATAFLAPQMLETELTRGELFLLAFYPLADLLMALGALHAARFFGQGQLGRAWYALFLFAVSDALYTWLLSEGIYILAGSSNALTLLTDMLYLGAYLLLGWAFQAQEYLLLYGPRWRHLRTIPQWGFAGADIEE
ncbi:MAG: hypothetical protein JW892_10625 [Anaerolineae bacterium]|nr:hypothetical protein [Anaerolineae bacterium]